jgi:class 3 adenylate cyclase
MERKLATVMFADLVASTELLAARIRRSPAVG